MMDTVLIRATENEVIVPKAYFHDSQAFEIIITADDIILRAKTTPAPLSAEQKQRALNAAGRFHAGVTDLAERHDDYLTNAFAV
jgi:hypothetical protein